jgi:hypothetical protein
MMALHPEFRKTARFPGTSFHYVFARGCLSDTILLMMLLCYTSTRYQHRVTRAGEAGCTDTDTARIVEMMGEFELSSGRKVEAK